ncbi:hypothetical protein KAR91_36630 [Candidatus Pacearchaeota archaeon]|nr:hypothetical protein [Candidatus Pacearchaeota archaeon]
MVDDLNKRPIPTEPRDLSDKPTFGQPVETTKDVFVLELEKFFDRNQISSSRLKEIPTIRKFDVSFNSKERSHETALKIIQKLPNINENLPLVAILGATGRNLPMGIGGQFVDRVSERTALISANAEPFVLEDDQTLIFRTTDKQKIMRTTTIIFRASRFNNIAQATAQEIINEINFQALFAKGFVADSNVSLAYGGPATQGITGDIEIGNENGEVGTAAAALGFTLGDKAEYTNSVASNRYLQSTYLDIAIEVVSEDSNVRTELNDLVWTFFTFYMSDRNYIFLGRSIFDTSISNETYQVIIKPDPSMAGESEVPRPGGDEMDKLYVNRINIPVTTIQYLDRSVVNGSGSPLYLDADDVEEDLGIPQKN